MFKSIFKCSPTVGLIALGLLFACDLVNAQATCPHNKVRKEVRQLSPKELGAFINGMKRLQDRGVFNWLGRIHNNCYPNVHDNIQLFPWHREALIIIENMLQEYDPEITIPYWDASLDFYQPAASWVFNPSTFGTNGKTNTTGTGGCVVDGFQAHSTNTRLLDSSGRENCLERNFNVDQNTISPWHSPEFVASIIQLSTSLEEFRKLFEYTYHDSVHQTIGGNMGTPWSPSDIFFYLHHSNIDRVWALWQYTHPDLIDDYVGLNGDSTAMSTINDRTDVWNTPIRELTRLGSGKVCFYFDNIGPAGARPPPASVAKGETSLMKHHPLLKLPEHIRRKWFPLGLNLEWMETVLPPIDATRKYSQTRPGNVVVGGAATGNTGILGAGGSIINSLIGGIGGGGGSSSNYGGDGVTIPQPYEIPDSTLVGMARNVTAKRFVERLVRDFVNDMSTSGYRSPYY
ncbi:hypothetical protein H4219_005935 [Mycoemilia scoparia]|uniref:Tyrosinase copper-binding domain-containing protein n=1 Tax=Mycoemilia scoparia TaxID=417184 RepID=A0A9W7ZKP7_9FUNG|nr:hypothetical protein H4219_005935 [Mycoemilia scoparia]